MLISLRINNIVASPYATDYNTSRTFTSDISLWLDEVTSDSLYQQIYYEIDVELSCIISTGTQTLKYSLASYNGSTVPDWVTLDSSNSKLTFTTPNVSTDTTYTFSIDSTIVETSETYQKPVSLTVLSCEVAN